MKKKILVVLLALTAVVGYAQTQKTPPKNTDSKEVAVFSFMVDDEVSLLDPNKDKLMSKETKNFIEASKETKTKRQVTHKPTTADTEQLTPPPTSPWYIGGGIGMSFGRNTFASFTADKTRPGFTIGVLGGQKISPLLSVEATLDYTRMTLGAHGCCHNHYLDTDGNRYFAPLTGSASYRYSDLRANTHLIGLGAHLNIDLLSLWKTNSRWSALVSPAFYGVCSFSAIKQSSTLVYRQTRLHLGAGLDLGAEYRIDDKWSVRLTTGMNYLTGIFDGLPQEEHKKTYTWNTMLNVIYKW